LPRGHDETALGAFGRHHAAEFANDGDANLARAPLLAVV
jgi:hypothetical protein